ncbi:hypothetical protein GCK72_007132 [Caenorhabditis remanei]|uniref:Uncharacterized protein n=1 Tax=Caenorhabditis remanei TaxID=31234 RepID=A0A6A5HLB2_CAERE|nr:hypothetical protein GCK72_007132 [Caenorhabditis remanei]KAF1767173.1 hypothetical protein GCK72_007132 [Caenorhabditis remanei]
MESPSLDTLCTTCLQDLYHYKFGRSCEDIEKEENYETLSLSTNELNSRIHRDYCRHGKCILKFENSWKWIIKDAAVKNAFDMMNTAIRMVEGHVDCKLRRDRMDCTIRALERIQENKEIGMRTQGAGFEEDIAGKMQRADRLLKSLKAQWAEFRFGIQLDGSSSTPFGIQCSCTKIHEHYVEIFLELPLQEQFGDKYDTVGNEFREIANYKLDEIISECPVNFQRGFEVPRIVDVYGKIVTLQ